MAHVETGHIHLGDSILHHTEGWETKKKKKVTGSTREHKDRYKHTCTYACMCTNTHTANNQQPTPLGPSVMNTSGRVV